MHDVAVTGLVGMAVRFDARQFLFQTFQPGDALADRGEMRGRDTVRLVMGHGGVLAQADQFANRLERQAEIAGMADEGQPVEFGAGVAALVAGGTFRRVDQAHLLVIADGRHLDAGASRHFADGEHGLDP